MSNKILLVIKSPPYGNLMAAEGLRIATALIAMDLLPQLIFIDDGLYCLMKDHQPEKAGLISFYDRLKTLSDLIGLCLDKGSLAKRGLKISDFDSAFKVKSLSSTEVAEVFAENETIIVF